MLTVDHQQKFHRSQRDKVAALATKNAAAIQGSRLKLLRFDQDLIERMLDFQEAYLDANEGTILAEALSTFIDAQVANNPDIRRRYEIARRRRRKSPPVANNPSTGKTLDE